MATSINFRHNLKKRRKVVVLRSAAAAVVVAAAVVFNACSRPMHAAKLLEDFDVVKHPFSLQVACFDGLKRAAQHSLSSGQFHFACSFARTPHGAYVRVDELTESRNLPTAG